MATSVRIRLCGQNTTVDQLAAHVEALRVARKQAVDRLVQMDRRNRSALPISQKRIDRTPAIKPVESPLESALRKSSGPVKSGRVKRVTRKIRRSRVSGRRQSARRYNRIKHYLPNQSAPARSGSAPRVGPGGRYLAPITNPPESVNNASPAKGRYRPRSGVSLPPEAYRGPQN